MGWHGLQSLQDDSMTKVKFHSRESALRKASIARLKISDLTRKVRQKQIPLQNPNSLSENVGNVQVDESTQQARRRLLEALDVC